MKPLLLLDPAPRTREDIFDEATLERLRAVCRVRERGGEEEASFYARHLPEASFVVGQPALEASAIEGAPRLRAVINVEGNFLQNMDYDACFRNKVHALVVSPVFAQPVAELALGLTLALARDIPAAHAAFADGSERYGLDGNGRAVLLRGCRLGFVGFGDLGRAIRRVFAGLECECLAYDPWVSPDVLRREGVRPASLEEVLERSDVVQVVASVTSESRHLLGAAELARLRPGALFLLLSRADVVDLDALIEACRRGRIRAATDVFPDEPLAADSALRSTPNLLLSAHRAGALASALREIGERVVADVELMAAGLPPQNCKRAEHELVARLQSRPVERS